MNKRETLLIAINNLRSNKLRTGLTMIGIIIGIASVVGITSVGQGVQKSTEKQLETLGTNILTVLADSANPGGINRGLGSSATLTWQDAQAISQQVTASQAVTAFLRRQLQVVYAEKNISTDVYGTDLNYPAVKNIYPQEGQFFTQEHLDTAKAVVVLGSKVKDELFGSRNSAIGADIRIRGRKYQVIGVMETKGAVGNQDQDDRIYLPLTNMSGQLVGNRALSGIAINGFHLQVKDKNFLDAANFQATNILRLRHNIYPPQADDFRIINQVEIIDTLTNIVGLFTIMMVIIAGISLVVGGIGIANIMLVSVVERTKEIGICKALGATNADILSQFLTEAIIVAIVGGSVGIGFGSAIAFVAALVFEFPFIISIGSVISAFSLSLLVGLMAGVIPARNAAQLDPIAALTGR